MNARPWWLQRNCMPGDDHDEDTCDHRHFVSELNSGWRFWTPAGRVEIITMMEPDRPTGGYWWRIWTVETGPGWSWRLHRDRRVHALPDTFRNTPKLRFIDLHGSSMHIVPMFGHDQVPDFMLALCEAKYLGHGLGWLVSDRPDGGDEVRTEHPTKARARTALLAAGRHHAKVLGLPLLKENEDA